MNNIMMKLMRQCKQSHMKMKDDASRGKSTALNKKFPN